MKPRSAIALAASLAAAIFLSACGARAREARAEVEAIGAAFEGSLARLLEDTRANAELMGGAYAREGSLNLDTAGMDSRLEPGEGYGGGLGLSQEPGLLGPQGIDVPAAADGDVQASTADAPEPGAESWLT